MVPGIFENVVPFSEYCKRPVVIGAAEQFPVAFIRNEEFHGIAGTGDRGSVDQQGAEALM